MERARLNHFDPEAIDGDGQSRPACLAPFVAGNSEPARPIAGVLVCAACVLVSLALVLWGAAHFLRAMLR